MMTLVSDFIQSHTLEKLLKLKKEDLLAIGKEFNLNLKRAMRKAQIVRSIAEYLIEGENYPEDFNESIWEEFPPDPAELSDKQFEIDKLRLEKQTEIEKAKIAADV